MRIACVVGGHGESEAVPILVRRVGEALDPPAYPRVERPIRVPESKLRKRDELERAVQLGSARSGSDGAVLVLMDCDDGCPAELAPPMLAWATDVRPDVPVGLVLAKREYETWFLAAAHSLRGRRGLRDDLAPPNDPEGVRGAKKWLSGRMSGGRSYRETLDQPALTAVFDLDAARRVGSFEKCFREIERLIRAAESRGS